MTEMERRAKFIAEMQRREKERHELLGIRYGEGGPKGVYMSGYAAAIQDAMEVLAALSAPSTHRLTEAPAASTSSLTA
jgi:hypothetical protein